MQTMTRDGARLATVTNGGTRGEAIKRRRVALGLTNHSQFARAIKDSGHAPIDRATLKLAEEGAASIGKMDEIENWLTDQEIENGHDEAEPPSMIRLTFHDIYGIGEVIAEGPSDHPDELVETVAKLLDRIRRRDADTDR